MLKHFSYPYGHGFKDFTLDDQQIIQEVTMPAVDPLENPKQAILDAITHPIGCPSLLETIKPNDTVTFICNDSTRVANSHIFMPILVNELNKLGVPDENMEIAFATGSHRDMSPEEMEQEVGTEIAHRLKMFNNECNNPDAYEFFGKTSFGTPVWVHRRICHRDHVILTGTVVFHYLAGYGGGRKAVVPGMAGMESIRMTHRHMLDPRSGLGKTKDNPAYKDFEECVGLWAKGRSVFLLNPILDEHHRFLKIFAGDYLKAHEAACRYVDTVYGVPIRQKADIVIASCGGYPKDINVYQMQKTMDNAMLAAKEGGVVIVLAECEEGAGNPVLMETCRRCGSIDTIEEELRSHFRVGAHKAYTITRLMRKAKFILVTGIDHQIARDLFFNGCCSTVAEAIQLAVKLNGKDNPQFILMPAGSLTVPLYKGQ